MTMTIFQEDDIVKASYSIDEYINSLFEDIEIFLTNSTQKENFEKWRVEFEKAFNEIKEMQLQKTTSFPNVEEQKFKRKVKEFIKKYFTEGKSGNDYDTQLEEYNKQILNALENKDLTQKEIEEGIKIFFDVSDKKELTQKPKKIRKKDMQLYFKSKPNIKQISEAISIEEAFNKNNLIYKEFDNKEMFKLKESVKSKIQQIQKQRIPIAKKVKSLEKEYEDIENKWKDLLDKKEKGKGKVEVFATNTEEGKKISKKRREIILELETQQKKLKELDDKILSAKNQLKGKYEDKISNFSKTIQENLTNFINFFTSYINGIKEDVGKDENLKDYLNKIVSSFNNIKKIFSSKFNIKGEGEKGKGTTLPPLKEIFSEAYPKEKIKIDTFDTRTKRTDTFVIIENINKNLKTAHTEMKGKTVEELKNMFKKDIMYMGDYIHVLKYIYRADEKEKFTDFFLDKKYKIYHHFTDEDGRKYQKHRTTDEDYKKMVENINEIQATLSRRVYFEGRKRKVYQILEMVFGKTIKNKNVDKYKKDELKRVLFNKKHFDKLNEYFKKDIDYKERRRIQIIPSRIKSLNKQIEKKNDELSKTKEIMGKGIIEGQIKSLEKEKKELEEKYKSLENIKNKSIEKLKKLIIELGKIPLEEKEEFIEKLDTLLNQKIKDEIFEINEEDLENLKGDFFRGKIKKIEIEKEIIKISNEILEEIKQKNIGSEKK